MQTNVIYIYIYIKINNTVKYIFVVYSYSIKKCSYHFLDNGDQGFKVQLVFEEKYRALICGKGHLLESTIEEFEITKEKISEMRRTKSTKTT